MAGSSQTTTDHDVIRRWAEERGGRPASVRDTGSEGEAGVLRLDFEEKEPDDRLEPIGWEEFFEKFEEAGLAFLYQDTLKSGEQSRFFKFVQREGTSRDMGGRGKRGSRGAGSADDDGDEKKPSSRARKAEVKAEGDDSGEKKATRRAPPKANQDEKAKEAEQKKAAREEEKRKEAEAKKRETEKQKEEARKPASRSRKTETKSGDSAKAGGARSGSSNTTTDPEEIRRWVEERNGHPARVRDTGGKDDPGLLRIDFEERDPDDRDARLEWIEWEEFFQKFEEAGLAFLYQDTLKSGEQSRFFKFVQREGSSRDMGGRGKRGSRGSGSGDK